MNSSDRPFEKRSRTLSFEDFFYSLSLQFRHRWLWIKSNQLDETIENIIKPVEGARRLFPTLLKRFKYIDYSHSQRNLRAIAHQIKDVWKCDKTKTVIMSIRKQVNNHPDGSSKMAYDLLRVLGDWNGHLIIDPFDENYAKLSKGYSVILCDDFIGSGSTIDNRIKAIKDMIAPQAKLYIVALAAMSEARDLYLNRSGSMYYSPVWLEKGITEKKKTQIMLRMESLLASKHKDQVLSNCSLGYGKAGSLYFNEEYRIPNNVYPIFWWGKYVDGRDFNSLFLRP